jgi:hypothetical protein
LSDETEIIALREGGGIEPGSYHSGDDVCSGKSFAAVQFSHPDRITINPSAPCVTEFSLPTMERSKFKRIRVRRFSRRLERITERFSKGRPEMNEATQLHALLSTRFPDLDIELDEPAKPEGSWYLIVARRPDRDPIYVEWREGQGFGISTPVAGEFGTGPDEVYPLLDKAFRRVVRLVLSSGSTNPPDPISLADLRRKFGLTQEELAERDGVK